MHETDEPLFAFLLVASFMAVLFTVFLIVSLTIQPEPDPAKYCYLMQVRSVESVKFDRVECPNP
jgi:hypothetical protein